MQLVQQQPVTDTDSLMPVFFHVTTACAIEVILSAQHSLRVCGHHGNTGGTTSPESGHNVRDDPALLGEPIWLG